jgi:imidazolonepropionase-like amidohydrolase
MCDLKRAGCSLLAFACLSLAVGWPSLLKSQSRSTARVTVFEGARLIVGDGSAPIEDSSFIVANTRFVQFGRKGELKVPAGAVHVDLSGKTVMPTMTDLHGHYGFQNVGAGKMSKDSFTRENLIDHMERLAYVGVGAAVGVGDLLDRSDLHGGRTHWGDVPVQLRGQVVPNAALFRTAGTGIAWPGSGPQGDPSRVDVPYPITTEGEARQAVRDYVKMKPLFIKIWVDDRGGTKKTLTPALYGAVADEAHKFNIPVGVHNVTLADAKQLMRDGVEGWLHVPVRGGEAVDDELLGIVKERIAKKDRPVMWVTPDLMIAWMDSQGGGRRPAWLDDPLLKDLYSPNQIEEYWGKPLAKMSPADVEKQRKEFQLEARNAMRLRAAGMRFVEGTDTGQTRFLVGYFNQLDLESMVAIGLTPNEVIVAATRDSAEIAHVNTGLIAPGKNADFIVLNANPLDNIANTRRIDKVYLRGQEVDRAALRAKWHEEFNSTNSKQ